MVEPSLIARHYEEFSEGPRLGKSRVRRLEFATSLSVLEDHLPPGARVLELGAGHGAYSMHFARRGFEVMATDLVECNVQAMRVRSEHEKLETLQVRRADATDLGSFSERRFGAVLCLGPFYHLRDPELRRRCLLECRRVVRDDGIVAVSYINQAFAVPYLIGSGRTPTPEDYAALANGQVPSAGCHDSFFSIAHLSAPDVVVAEVRACGFDVVDHAGTDGIYGFFPAALEELEERAYQDFRSHHIQTCTQPAIRAVSPHCLLILQKTPDAP